MIKDEVNDRELQISFNTNVNKPHKKFVYNNKQFKIIATNCNLLNKKLRLLL
jgi:hypothetical protein